MPGVANCAGFAQHFDVRFVEIINGIEYFTENKEELGIEKEKKKWSKKGKRLRERKRFGRKEEDMKKKGQRKKRDRKKEKKGLRKRKTGRKKKGE